MSPDDRAALDDVITGAARALTDVGPAPGLADRVVARLDAGTGRRWGWLAWPAGGVAAAGLAGAVWLASPSPVPAIGQPLSGAPPLAVARIDVATLAPKAIVAPPPVDAAPSATAESAAAIAWRARAIPALEPPSAIAMSAIQPNHVALPLLHVEPLVTARLELAPLAPGRPAGR